jgi:predicted nucleic acid-binding protein
MYKICTVQNFSKEMILSASDLRARYSFSFWDSMIVASAVLSQCNILASEDMQNNMVVKNVNIKNIFLL